MTLPLRLTLIIPPNCWWRNKCVLWAQTCPPSHTHPHTHRGRKAQTSYKTHLDWRDNKDKANNDPVAKNAGKKCRLNRTTPPRTITHVHLFKTHRWNDDIHFTFLALPLRTRLHFSFLLMSAWEVASEGLGKFVWCPWKFGFKLMQMQHPSSILPRWLFIVIHIKTLSLSSEKYSALSSKWKCISITTALFFHCISSVLSFYLSLLLLHRHQCYTFQSVDLSSVLSSITIRMKPERSLPTIIVPADSEFVLMTRGANEAILFANCLAILDLKVSCVTPALGTEI